MTKRTHHLIILSAPLDIFGKHCILSPHNLPSLAHNENSEAVKGSACLANENMDSCKTPTSTDLNRRGLRRLVNRELVPWVPDDDSTALEDLTLTSQAKKGAHWDQFAANKAQFGVQTSFDEDVSHLTY